MHSADSLPLTAGPLHRSPVRLECAAHRGALFINSTRRMELTSLSILTLALMRDVAYNGLPAALDIHMLHRDGLFAPSTMFAQGLHLRGKCSGQLI